MSAERTDNKDVNFSELPGFKEIQPGMYSYTVPYEYDAEKARRTVLKAKGDLIIKRARKKDRLQSQNKKE